MVQTKGELRDPVAHEKLKEQEELLCQAAIIDSFHCGFHRSISLRPFPLEIGGLPPGTESKNGYPVAPERESLVGEK